MISARRGSGEPFPVRIVADQIYDTPCGTALRADLYVPQGAAAPVPAVIWLHGGGWRYGNRRVSPDLRRCFAERGLAAIAIDYRLSDAAEFPAQIADVRTAIRWVRHVAGTYGLGDRIGLCGGSAGGHLAALAALCPRGLFEPDGSRYLDRSSEVQAVVTGYAPIDFLQLDVDRLSTADVEIDPQNLALPPGMRSADPDSFESLLLGAPIHDCPDRVREANPLTYARAGAPPFMIVHGLSDTTVGPRQSERLYRALAAHDNDVTLCLIERLGHGFLNRTNLDDGSPWRMTVRQTQHGAEPMPRVERPIFSTIESFFRQYLEPRTGPAETPAPASS